MTEAEKVSPPRLPKPESLEAKFKLLAKLPYDRRAKRKHSLVFGFILDWYHSKYGNALASVRHVTAIIKERDPASVGLYAGDVHSALTDLVAWGYLEQEKGIGRRASRYVPVWDSVCVHRIPNTTNDEISVRENANTCVRENANTTGDSVRDFMNQDPSTPTRALDPGTEIDGHECAAPVAPPADGLAATAAETAQGFEELWRAYGFKQKKKEAKAAYATLAPDAEQHSSMVAAAIAWRESWAAQNKPDAPRYTLAKWIEREDFDCTPPTGYQPKERKASAPPARKPAPQLGRREAECVDADVSGEGWQRRLALTLEFKDGQKIVRDFWLVLYSDEPKREQSLREYNELCSAMRISENVRDADELLFRPFIAIEKADGSFRYEAAPVNDNAEMEQAA